MNLFASLIPQPNLSEVRWWWVLSPCPYVKPLTRLNAGLTTIAVPPGLLTCAVSPTRHTFSDSLHHTYCTALRSDPASSACRRYTRRAAEMIWQSDPAPSAYRRYADGKKPRRGFSYGNPLAGRRCLVLVKARLGARCEAKQQVKRRV